MPETKGKKTSAKKVMARKTSARKAAAKKGTAKKATARKATAKEATAKQATAKKATAEKATAKKTSAKKATAKGAPPERDTAKKGAAKKSTPQRRAPKTRAETKAAGKTATAKKSPPKRARKRKVETIVFFGTPEFAVPTLDALAAAGRTPALVVSRPAKAAGRGKKAQDPPVAAWAKERGIEVVQPESVRGEEFLDRLRELGPDLGVVVAFGRIFPAELLGIPRLGLVNVHASLLPKYRGASPIQAALAAGEKKTGVTIMQVEEELDAGPILGQEEVRVRLHETAGELSERLAEIGGRLLVETVDRLEAGKVKERKQRDESASYAGTVEKEQGRVNWALEAEELYNLIRAYDPWPGMTATFRGSPLKIVWAVPMTWEKGPIGETGTYLGLRQGRLAVLAGGGTILGVEELQRPGKSAVRASDFVNGERLRVGERFA